MDEKQGDSVIDKYVSINTELKKYISALEKRLEESTNTIRELYLDKINLEKKEMGMMYRLSYLERRSHDPSSAQERWEQRYRRLLRCFNALRAHAKVKEESVVLESEIRSLLSSDGDRQISDGFNLDATMESSTGERPCPRDGLEDCNMPSAAGVEGEGECDANQGFVERSAREHGLCMRVEALERELESSRRERRMLLEHSEDQKNQIMYLLEMLESRNTDTSRDLLTLVRNLTKRNREIKESYLDTIGKMKAEIEEKSEAAERLRTRCEYLEGEYQKHRDECREHREDVCDLATIHSSAESLRRLDELRSENAYLVGQNRALYEQSGRMELEMKEVKRELLEKGRCCEDMAVELRFKRLENENLVHRNTALERISSNYQEKLAENTKLVFIVSQKDAKIKELERSAKQIEERYNKYVLSNETHGALIGEIERVAQENRNVREEAKALTAALRDKENEIRSTREAFEASIAEYKREIAALESRMAAKDLEKNDLETRLAALARELEKAKEEVLEKETYIATVCRKCEDKLRNLKEQREEMDRLEFDIIGGLKRKVEGLESIIREKDAALNDMINQSTDETLRFLGRERFLMAEDNRQLRQKISLLESDIDKSSVQRYAELLGEYEESKRQSARLASDMEARIAESERRRQDDIAVLEQRNMQLAAQCEEATMELERYRKLHEDASVEKLDLASENEICMARVRELESELQQKEETIEKYVVVIDKLKKVKEAYERLRKGVSRRDKSEIMQQSSAEI